MKSIIASTLLLFSLESLHLNALELSLRQAAELAVTVSPDLAELRAQIGSAAINYRRQITQFLPQLTLTAGRNENVPLYTPDTDQYTFSAQVSQPVFNGGRTMTGRKLSKMQIVQQQNNFALQEEGIMDQVWDLYFGIISQQQRIALYKRALEITDYQIQVSRVQLELGELTELDFLEAEIQYNTFKSNVTKEELALQEMEFQFKRLLSIGQHVPIEFTDTIPVSYSGITIPFSVEQLFDIANTNNLSIKQSVFELSRIKTQIKLEKLSFLPQISLNGSYSLSDNDLPLQNQSFSFNIEFSFPFKNLPFTATIGYNESINKSYGVSQNLRAPVSNDIGYIAERKATSLTYQAKRERLASVRDALFSDLYFFIENLNHQKTALEQLRSESELYTKKAALMKLQLDLGETKLTDYLEAEKEAYEKQYAIIESVLELKKSERELEKMLGLQIGELSNVYPK